MPANLPPEYYAAEERFKKAATAQEKISALEELISKVPKHKGTDKLRADLRRRLSQLREEAVKKKRSGKGDLYTVERQGAAQLTLAGFPNSGKSSILATLTNAHPVVADYPMSTVMPLSGMMPFEDIQFQIVDLPPIGNESTDGWVSGIIRTSDLILLVVDLSEDPEIQAELLLEQLKNWGITILRKDEMKDENARPAVIVANKSDLEGSEEKLRGLGQTYGSMFPVTGISIKQKQGIEELRRIIFEKSSVIRAYSKEPGKEPDINAPFILRDGATVLDLADRIHKDFVQNLKYACIWGSARFDGQRVQRDYVLHDKDIVEFHVK
jgi:ribosome-interacting GTPase 1